MMRFLTTTTFPPLVAEFKICSTVKFQNATVLNIAASISWSNLYSLATAGPRAPLSGFRGGVLYKFSGTNKRSYKNVHIWGWRTSEDLLWKVQAYWPDSGSVPIGMELWTDALLITSLFPSSSSYPALKRKLLWPSTFTPFFSWKSYSTKHRHGVRKFCYQYNTNQSILFIKIRWQDYATFTLYHIF